MLFFLPFRERFCFFYTFFKQIRIRLRNNCFSEVLLTKVPYLQIFLSIPNSNKIIFKKNVCTIFKMLKRLRIKNQID